jgi:hypothetical protein
VSVADIANEPGRLEIPKPKPQIPNKLQCPKKEITADYAAPATLRVDDAGKANFTDEEKQLSLIRDIRDIRG